LGGLELRPSGFRLR